MKPYLVNQLLEFTDEGRTERVLWIDTGGAGFYAIDINSATALPMFRPAGAVEESERANTIRPAQTDPWATVLDDAGLPEGHKARRDAAWAMIRPLVFDQPAVFAADRRGPSVRRVMAEHGVTKQTLYRLLRRYWQRGMVPNALLPDFNKSGGLGKDKAVTTAKRGRPRLYGSDAGINIDADTRSLFRTVVTQVFAQNAKMDMQEAYSTLIRRHYSAEALDERTGQQQLVPLEARPTPAQFRYWSEKDNDMFRVERIRRTPRIYDKDMRAVLGSSTGEVVGPGSRYQIDATIADVYLVSRFDPRKIVGRPVVTIVIDVFSRMIVGVHVGLEGPSWVSAMMALANTVSDKVEFCHQFGIDIGPADWPCQALPDTLLADRGELGGSAIETLIKNFNVTVENAAPYRADWKGIVEQRFRMLPAVFKAYTPGFIQPDYRARGGRDYRLDATLNIDHFTRILILGILNHNNVRLCRHYERSADMVADGIKAVPIELWEWGIAHRSGRLRVYPADLVKLSLLPSAEATVTASGIRFYGCYYSCQKALEEHWFERARQDGGWKVRISYEPRCMDDIYLHEGVGRGRFLTCSLTDRSREYRGRTLWEIDQIRQEDRRHAAEHKSTELRAKINMTEAVKAIIDEAEAIQAAAPPPAASNRARTADIRANRAAEKAANRSREAFRFTKDRPDGGGQVVAFPGITDDDYSIPEVTDSLRNHGKDSPDDDR